MKFNEEKVLEIMEEYGVIGDEEYGGDGSDGEFVLVGIIYGVFITSKDSITRLRREDMEIFKYGEFSYIVWLKDEEEEDMEDVIQWRSIPIALEGPFTDSEIVGLINGGSL
ncbi:hypothetical protein ACNF40_07970 [Cuniculiplasma sp. SKW4]